MSAPRLAAKGAGILAQKIKEETRFDDIPTVENVPGSCAVSQCRSGAEIPIELYKPSPKF
jgi:flagellar biosynthetic protein FlhB